MNMKKMLVMGTCLLMLFSGTCVAKDNIHKGESVTSLRYFMQPSEAVGSKTPYGNNSKAGHYIQADDAKLYYEIYGKGKSIFVLHGGGVGTPYEMGKLIDTLSKDYQVVVVSTRGHGRSEIGHKPLSYEQKAEDIATVMSAVTKDSALVLGFSDGAYTSYKLASMYPDKVERIVAIGAGTVKPGYFDAEGMTAADLEKMDPLFVVQQKKIMPEPERFSEFWHNYMSFWSKMTVGKDLLSTIECPVLLLAGDEDDHAPIITVLEAHQYIPNSRLCIVPKAWHAAFLDNYSVTWAAIEAFLKADKSTLATGSKKVEYNNSFIK